ncbi:uncharacterized protein DNG_09419 [Cephalotrichum gorgonifer]|uniref:Uncharacterized protein n=1 Tax=Cephalotrichum gorgonifer TaxID=2041049 RepID=A0AAE8N5P0_9PEZI|nr:uncharacterized protein DNG_09419 [Cephalotrichum gorgonifer]
MATATLLRPSAPYSQPHSQPHSYSPGYPNAPAPSNKSDMISPIEPRRASDPADAPQHRQSLPSISEVISSAGSPVGSLSQPPPPISIPSFPSPFSASPRPYSDPHTGHDKGPSTHPLHPPPTYPSRQEPLPPFGDSSRAHHPFASRPGPSPLHSFSPPHPSPPTKPEQPRLESDSIADQHAMNGGYRHPPPIAPYSTTGQLAPGQLPQPSPYPLSPRHAGPPVHSPFDPQRGPPPRQEEGEDARARYEMPLNRHIEAWTYQECLSRIASSSRTIFNFAEGYGKIAQEQHTSRPIPERLPTEREVTDMLGNLDYIRRSLENVRDLVQQSTRAEIPREVPAKAPFEEEDVQIALHLPDDAIAATGSILPSGGEDRTAPGRSVMHAAYITLS